MVRSVGAARAWIISWVTSIVHVLGHRWTLGVRSLSKKRNTKFFVNISLIIINYNLRNIKAIIDVTLLLENLDETNYSEIVTIVIIADFQ